MKMNRKIFNKITKIKTFDPMEMTILNDGTQLNKVNIQLASNSQISGFNKAMKELNEESLYEIGLVYNKEFDYYHTALFGIAEKYYYQLAKTDKVKAQGIALLYDEVTDGLKEKGYKFY